MILRGEGLGAVIEDGCWNCGTGPLYAGEETGHDVTIGFTDVVNVAPAIMCPDCRARTKVEKGKPKRDGFAGLMADHPDREQAIIYEGALPGVVVDLDETSHKGAGGGADEDETAPESGTVGDGPSPSTAPPPSSSLDEHSIWYEGLVANLEGNPEDHTNYHATLSRKGLPCPECGPDNDWLEGED